MADTIDTLAQVMKDLRARFGDDAFTDRRRLISLLSDRLPDARREIRAIGTALDEGVPAALRGAQRELIGLEMDRQADRLEGGTGLRADLAKATVRAFAFALDLGALPSVYPAANNAAPTAPVPSSGTWVGTSVPPGTGNPQPPYGGTSYYQQTQPTVVTAGPRAPMANWMKVAIGVAAIVLVAILYKVLTNDPNGANQNGVVAPGVAQPGTAGGGQNPAGANDGYGGEAHDFGIAPQATLQNNVGSATPTSIPVGTTVTTQQLQQMIAANNPQLIDVLGNPHSTTIRGAIALPEAGQPGTFDDATQAAVAATLQSLPAVRNGRPLIFFCVGVECWESYNAVLRANAAGLHNLYWYRGGLSAWQAAGGSFMPMPQATRQQNDDNMVP